MRKPLVSAILLAWTTAAVAGEILNPVEALRRKQFAGWDGIVFYCTVEPKDKTNTSLCEWAGQRLRLAAQSTKDRVLLVPADPFQRALATRQAKLDYPIELELDVVSTNNTPVGLHVKLTAKEYYTNAADQYAQASSPKGQPKSGVLVFWEKDFVASSPQRGADLDQSLRQVLETFILQFVSDFAEARR